MDPFSNVYPVLVECFGIILIGYLCGRTGIVSESQANGLQVYISKIALPAIVFKSMVELDFSKVNWFFWLGILLAKFILFVSVVTLTLIVNQPISENLGRAGIYGIFATQSNDLALGIPLFDAIYRSTHPEYLQYIYLLIPVSFALLNPIGFMLLEFNKNATNNDQSRCRIILNTLKGVITNPLVFMVILGLAVNQIFIACSFNRTNWFLTPFLKVLADSFGATALFYLGTSLVGNMKKYTGFNLVVPFLLVTCKSLILPLVAREAVFWLGASEPMKNATHDPGCLGSFAFLYGTLPTAPPVVLFATMYNVEVDTIGTSMVLGTLLAAPIMFVSSKMISMMKLAAPEVDKAFKNALFDLGILSTVCCVWIFFVFFFTKLSKRPLHQFTLCLVFMQFLSSVALILNISFASKVVLAMFIFGLIGNNFWTALLTFGLSAARCKGEQYAIRCRPFVIGLGFIVPLCFALSLPLSDVGSKYLPTVNNGTNPLLYYMRHNNCFISLHSSILIVSVITTIVFLIILQRCDKYCRCKNSLARLSKEASTNSEKTIDLCKNICRSCRTLSRKQSDIEDMTQSQCIKRTSISPSCSSQNINHSDHDQSDIRDPLLQLINSNSVKDYESTPPFDRSAFDELKDIEEMSLEEYLAGDRHQLSRHIILVLVLSVFSILAIFVNFGRLFGDTNDHISGIYVEIEFLVTVCIAGQGFVSFAVFGFNKMLFNFLSFERLGILQPGCVARKIELKPVSSLNPSILNLCHRFELHHLEKCREDLITNLKFHFKTYKDVFQGNKLVDWLIEFGLANTRIDAVSYGNCLLRGRVIKHCVEEHYFYDLPYYYQFCITSSSQKQGTSQHPQLEDSASEKTESRVF